jgi:2'-5' RNA ligase
MQVTAACLMLQVPKELSEKILAWANEHIKPEDVYNKEGKGLQKGHHITLAPQISDESADPHIMSVMNNTPALSANLGQVGFFVQPDKEYHVLKIAVDPANLLPIREKVVEGIEMYNPTHDFNPHVTIAYLNPGACQDLDGDETFNGMACDINSCLYSSVDGGDKFVNLQPAPGPVKVEAAKEISVTALRELILARLSSTNA